MVLLFAMCSSAIAEPYRLRIGIQEGYFNYLETWISVDVFDGIIDGSIRPLDRAMAELFIQVNALESVGFEFEYELVVIPNARRAGRHALERRIDIMSSGYWESDPAVNLDVFTRTKPYLHNGESLVGFFTGAGNDRALAAKSVKHLRELRHVAVQGWMTDIQTMQAYGAVDIRQAQRYASLVKMLSANYADVTLLEFHGKGGLDRLLWEDGVDKAPIVLKVIPGIKAYLDGQRVFVVSKKSPKYKVLLKALDDGIALMRKNGSLKKILKESGFYPSEVEDWQVIYPHAAP